MTNPFPGMDPWMEDQWGDAHHSLITYARDQLREVLPSDLRPRVEERVFIESPLGVEGDRFPDLRVIEHLHVRRPATVTTGGIATAEPLVIELATESMTQGYIQILDAKSGNRVVTVIEVLSPSNKRPGDGQRMYLAKRAECQAAGTNFVEIDLLRGGKRVSLIPDSTIPVTFKTAYRITVWRAAQPLAAEIYRVPLREPLPAIHIPLRETDSDAPLRLQPLLDSAYRNGTYEDTDYAVPPIPPLDPDDERWADELLRTRGLRK